MIAAFDMGIKNFAFAVKDPVLGEFELLKNTCLVEEDEIDLNKYKKQDLAQLMFDLKIDHKEKIKKKDMINLILTKKGKGKPKTDLGLSMFQIMDDHRDIWEKCNIFLIERQMTINLQALKLSHYLEAYLKIYFPTKTILNYSASIKTKKLGAVDLKSKNDRKKWTVQYVSKLLKGDNLKYFQTLKKQDDIADVVCMIQAYLIS
jgi:hypothetical protein